MKKILTLIGVLLMFCASYKMNAQTFAVQHDTVLYTYVPGSGLQNIDDEVDNLSTVTSDSVIINWKMIASDFPSDWVALSGVCDNSGCYNFSYLWPSGTLRNSNKYPDGLGPFHLQTNLSTATSGGTYYFTVRLYNSAVPTDSATETYVITRRAASAVPSVTKSDEVVLYPNPATSELNVVYDASADIKTIAVYNIIGKVMTVYKVTGNTGANLNIDNLSSGIYFVRLVNSHGEVVVTRKFTKQ